MKSQFLAHYMAQVSDRDLVDESKSVFERIGDSVLSGESLLVLTVSVVAALLIGRIIASILRRTTKLISARADKIEDLGAVNRLRRLETLIVLSIALIRTLLVLFAIYFWWSFTHDDQQSTAILGAGAILTLVLSAALAPILRDVANGSVMMAEQWYGVGDHISIEPFVEAQGIVERVTLRSTKIRKFNGEILWVNNKDIAGVSITPKGVRTVVIELFARDLDGAVELVESANLRLPVGPLAVVSPLSVMTTSKIGNDLWHVTAVSEVAPGREWFLDKFAISVMQELDEKNKILYHEPISRYADSEAERRFGRAIHNARKSNVHRDSVVFKVTNAANKVNDAQKRKRAASKLLRDSRKDS